MWGSKCGGESVGCLLRLAQSERTMGQTHRSPGPRPHHGLRLGRESRALRTAAMNCARWGQSAEVTRTWDQGEEGRGLRNLCLANQYTNVAKTISRGCAACKAHQSAPQGRRSCAHSSASAPMRCCLPGSASEWGLCGTGKGRERLRTADSRHHHLRPLNNM